jgi:hypothetical protein
VLDDGSNGRGDLVGCGVREVGVDISTATAASEL